MNCFKLNIEVKELESSISEYSDILSIFFLKSSYELTKSSLEELLYVCKIVNYV